MIMRTVTKKESTCEFFQFTHEFKPQVTSEAKHRVMRFGYSLERVVTVNLGI